MPLILFLLALTVRLPHWRKASPMTPTGRHATPPALDRRWRKPRGVGPRTGWMGRTSLPYGPSRFSGGLRRALAASMAASAGSRIARRQPEDRGPNEPR